MKIELLKSSSYKVMPWRNGKGITSEIAIHPANASLAANDFEWRLSSAGIVEAGIFSKFAGCQRHLAVLSGEGVRLQLQNQTGESVLRQGDSLQFSGDLDVRCRLIQGSVKDLNLIVQNRFQGRELKSTFEIRNEAGIEVPCLPGVHLIFVISGQVSVRDSARGVLVTAQPFETIRVEAERSGSKDRTESFSIEAENDIRFALMHIEQAK